MPTARPAGGLAFPDCSRSASRSGVGEGATASESPVAGLLSGNITGPRLSEDTTVPLRTFWTGLDDMLNALLFVFVGFHVVLINPLVGVTPGVPAVVAITGVLFARALTVSAIVGGLNAVGAIRADCLGLTKLLTWPACRWHSRYRCRKVPGSR